MLRRVLIFLVTFAAGLGTLMLVIGKDELLSVAQSNERDTSPVRSLPPGAVRISGGTSGVQGLPSSGAAIAFEGRGELSPMQDAVRIGDRVWQVPEFKLEWDDSQPAGSGRYRLLRVTFTSYERITAKTVKPRVHETMRLEADSMELVLAQKGDELAIDSEHDVAMRGVRLLAPRETLGAAFASEVELVTESLRARLAGELVDLETPAGELVTIRSLPKPGATMQYTLVGRGLVARLDEIQKVGEEIRSVGASRITLRSDIDLSGKALEKASSSEFRLRSDGPLDIRAHADALVELTVEDKVRFEATGGLGGASGSDAGPNFEARGERATAWMRRGGLVREGDGELKRLAFTDLMIYGAKRRDDDARAQMRFGGQTVRAREFEMSLDPWSRPERLTARGAPRVDLRASDGKALGSVHGEARMISERPSVSLESALQLLGVDFASRLLALRAVEPVFPHETLRVEGPARFVPAGVDATVREARCSRGVLVTLTSALGRLEPNLVLGRGDARIAGVMRGGRSFAARGNRGFVIAHTPGSPKLHARLGPITADASHEFHFVGADDVVSGRGLVAMEFVAKAPEAVEPASRARATAELTKRAELRSGSLEFVAALRQELTWKHKDGADRFDVTGIKLLRFSQSDDKRRAIRATGLPLRMESAGFIATAESAERAGDDPWLFRSSCDRVHVDLEARDGRAPAGLFAKEVRVRAFPGMVPADKAIPELRVLASGKVRLETEDEARGLSVELDCDELERFPQPARPLLLGAALDALGDAGHLLAPVLWGSEAGLLHARGHVRVAASERVAKGIAEREFSGDSLWIDADRGLGRFILAAGAKNGIVKARMAEPGRGIVELEASKITGREGEFELASFETADERACLVRLIEDGSDKSSRRLLLRSSESIRMLGDELRLPGPVVARMVDSEDRYQKGDFELRSRGDAVVHLQRTSKRKADGSLGVALPTSIERCVASGGVEMRWAQVVAVGEKLRFTPLDAWLILDGAEDDVHVTIAESTRVRAYPELAFNVRTHDYRGTRLRVEGSVGSR